MAGFQSGSTTSRKSPKVFVDPSADSCWFFRPGPARDFASGHGIIFLDNPTSADIAVFDRMARLRMFALKHPRIKLMIWTQEPRYDINTLPTSLLFGFFKSVRIMNVYTGNVFMSNTGIWGHRIAGKLNEAEVRSAFRRKSKQSVIVATYQSGDTSLYLNKQDIDLINIRQNLAMELKRLGFCDIYGKNWPQKLSFGESRDGNWKESKDSILREYRYNSCLENTDYPFYCTEKIWDSIRNACIPIYTGNRNKIYHNFEQDSFIDISQFENPEALSGYLIGLSEADLEKRLFRCVDAYNAAYAERHERQPNTAEEVVLKFIEVIKSL